MSKPFRQTTDWEEGPMATLAKKTDAEIQQNVLREFMWDTRVAPTDVGVQVDRGVVTLSGTVSSWGKRIAADEAAHRVWGVLDVANDIVVKVPGSEGRTDTEIARAIRTALEWDVFVPHARVQSTVSEGVVTLKGEVDFWTQREAAEKAIRNLAGVKAVLNQILVKTAQVAAADLQGSIEEALERQAEREAKRINMEIHDGRVKLSGTVHSWAERDAVIGAARGTRGVRNVEDQLSIRPYA
jgi:osmotically-inducible protein OsmY